MFFTIATALLLNCCSACMPAQSNALQQAYFTRSCGANLLLEYAAMCGLRPSNSWCYVQQYSCSSTACTDVCCVSLVSVHPTTVCGRVKIIICVHGCEAAKGYKLQSRASFAPALLSRPAAVCTCEFPANGWVRRVSLIKSSVG